MSEKEVRILKVLDELFIIRNSNDHAELAQKIIHTQQELDMLQKLKLNDQTEKQHNDILIEKMQNDILKTVSDLTDKENCHDFFQFAFHLRKLDAQNNDIDKYSRKILGLLQNRQVLLDIVFSNYWCTQSNEMKVKSNINFKLQIGNKYFMQYQNNDSQQPFSVFNKKVVNKGCCSDFQFLLTEDSIQIGKLITIEEEELTMAYHQNIGTKKTQWFKLITEYGYVQQQSDFVKWCLKGNLAYKDYQWIVLAGPQHPQYDNPDSQKWSLIMYEGAKRFKKQGNPSLFYLQLNYSCVEKKPRLLAESESPYFYSRCKATVQEDQGYSNIGQSLWKIERILSDDQSDEQDYLYHSQSLVFDEQAQEQQFVQKVEDLGWIELQDLIEKLGKILEQFDLKEVCIQMNKASVISLNDGKLFESTLINIKKILPMTKYIQIDQYLEEIDPILKIYEGIEVELVAEICEGCEYEFIQDVLPVERDVEFDSQFQYDSLKTIVDEDNSINLDKITDNDFTEIVNQIIHYNNQVHVLMFWSPWVTKSHKMVTIAQKALQHNHKKWKETVKMSAISIKTSHQIVPQLIEAKNWDLIDHYYRDGSNCFETYSINSVPIMILVDTEGIIAYKGEGFKDMEDLQLNIDQLLNGKKIKHQIELQQTAAAEIEKRKHRKSQTEMMPCDIHDKFDDFNAKLGEIRDFEPLTQCLSSGIKRAFLRMAYTETYDPMIDGHDKQVRDFRVNRMLTGKQQRIEQCESILDQIFKNETIRVDRKYTITDKMKNKL